jgi:hypothetical protein
MKRIICNIISASLISAILISCIDDFNKDLETIEYNPEFSIPIGPLSYILDDIMPPVSLSEYSAPDTAASSDTSLIIYNDDLYFYNPESGFDTTFLEPANFGSLTENTDNVVSVMLRTNLTNNIPTVIGLQAYLRNGFDMIVDSISRDGIVMIDCPEINQEGQITQPTKVTIDTHFDADRINELAAVTYLEIYIFIQTYNEGIDRLHVYSWNGIDLQFGLRAELLVPVNVQ